MEWWLKSLFLRFGFVLKRRRLVARPKTSICTHSHPVDLMDAIHGRDVYNGFDYRRYEFDLAGWGSSSAAFSQMIREVRPDLIIEVGSWKGASAIEMADVVKQEKLDTKILCIDTWLGALEFRLDQNDPKRFLALECEHGYPRVYYRFLANVCHAQHQNRIIPVPLDSAAAALWLMAQGLKADLIYIDGSHEEEAVYNDLLDYREVLSLRGRMFGDDWDWASVRSAVSSFARDHKLCIEHCHDKWVLVPRA